MSIDTKIKGWNFSLVEKEEQHFSADGSTTIDSLRSDLEKLEKRLAELPGLIKSKQNLVDKKRQDAAYLKGLKKHKRKKWEKANGKSAIATADKWEDEADNLEAEITSLQAELKQLPDRIDSLKKQINTLVNAESQGMQQGIDPASAKQLGEMAVAKEQDALKKQQEIEQSQKAAQQQAQQANQQTGKQNNNTWIVIGGVGLLLLIVGIVAVLKFKSKPIKVTAA